MAISPLVLHSIDDVGHVEPGGPGAVLGVTTTLDHHGHNHISIVKFSVGELDNNVYIITCRGHGVLVDPCDEPDRIWAAVLAAGAPRIHTVILTHGHRDHWQALERTMQRLPQAICLAHPADHEMVEADVVLDPLEHGDTIRVSQGVHLEVIHTPGHTPGSICLLLGEEAKEHEVAESSCGHSHGPSCGVAAAGQQIIAGDTLFPGGFGKTADKAAFEQIADSVQTQLLDRFGTDVGIHPGHGDSTTLAEAHEQIGTWSERGW